MTLPEILKIGILGILLLGLIFAVFLFKKKISTDRNKMSSSSLRLVGSLQVGTRERLIVVEAEGERLLLAVSPSQLRLVTSLKKRDSLPSSDEKKC
jgi:flagellar biosynthetic protein FliO